MLDTIYKQISKFPGTTILVATLLLTLVGAPFVAKWWDFWAKNPEVLILLVISFVSPGIVLYVQNRKEEQDRYVQNRKEEQDRHQWLLEKRASVLEEVVSVYGEVVAHGKMPDSPRKRQKFAELVKKMQKNKSKLIVWAPPSVIRALEYAEEASYPGKCATHEELLGVIDDLFRTIRKELDHDDSALEKYELMGVFLVPESRKGLGLKGFDDR